MDESEQWFRSVFDTSAVGMTIVAPDGVLLQANAAYCQMLGYTQAELETKTCQQLIHPDEVEGAWEPLRKLLSGEIAVYHTERRYMHKQGHVVWGLVSISTMRDRQQQPLYVVYQVQDISDRQAALHEQTQAEAKLRESEQRFRNVFANSAVGSVIVSSDGAFLEANAAFCQMLGYTEAELLTLTFYHVTHSDDRSQNPESVRKLIAGEMTCSHIEKRYLHKDGHSVWGLLSVSAVRDRQQPLYYIAQVQDITDRKQAEADRRESEQRFRNVFDNTAVGSAIVSPPGDFVQVNAAYCQMLGYTEAALLTMNFQQVTHPDDLPIDLANVQKIITGEISAYHFEKRYLHQDGHIVWGLLSISVVRDRQHQPLYYIAQVQNITDRKQAEVALQQFNQALEQRVQKRTAQLEQANRQLQVAIAQHEQTEAALRKSEERFRTIFDTARIAISLANSQTYQIVHVNQTYHTLFGYSNADLATMTHVSMTHPDDIAPNIHLLNQLLDGALDRFRIEKRFRKKNGDWIWANLTVTLVRDPDGRIYSMGMIEDISDRKRAEAALRDNQQLLQLVMDSVPTAIFWKDQQLRYLGCNQQFAIDAGLATPQDIIGKTDVELPWAVHAARCQAEDLQVLTTNQPTFAVEELLVKAGGEQRWIKASKVPLHDQTGAVVGILGTYDDITERRQADQALRLTQFSIDRAADPVWWVESDGLLYYLNAAACRDLGYTRDEIVGKKRVCDFNPDLPPEAWAAHWQMIKGKGSFTFEGRIQAKDGTFFPIEVTANHVELDGKEYHCSFVRNMTDRKKAEAQLRASLTEKEVLLKEIHHRVKNNLQTVYSLLNLQANTIQDPNVLAPFRDSQYRVKAMALLHEKLYRSDSLARVNFSEYVHNLVTDLIHSYSSQPANIRLTLEIAPLELSVDVAMPCGFIINELVTNSLKYAFPGDRGGDVRICFARSATNQYVLVVADDGIGFPQPMTLPDALASLNSLGLQLVKAFVHQLDGTVELDSRCGSKFEIVFPDPA